MWSYTGWFCHTDQLAPRHGLYAYLYELAKITACDRKHRLFPHSSAFSGSIREHGEAGDHAASASSSTCISGYQRLNTSPNSPFRVFTRVCNNRCAGSCTSSMRVIQEPGKQV